MKKLLCAIVLMLSVFNANAGGSSVIHAEFTLYPEGPLYHDWTWCVWGPDATFDQGDGTHGVQCVSVPGTIIAITGTSTVKDPGNEVLAFVICNGVSLWRGEHFQGTVSINTYNLLATGVTGPCHVGIQSAMDRGGAYARSGYEIQFTIFYQ